MARYDPKAKRAHSPAAPDGPAPVDDLLGAPPDPSAPRPEPGPTDAPVITAPAPTTSAPGPRTEPRPLAPTPAAAGGPGPKVLAALAAGVLALLLFWRHHRRGSI